MTTPVNDRDVLLEGGARGVISPSSALILNTSSPSFFVKADGSHTPDTIAIQATPLLLTGPITFSVTGATLSNITANSCSVAYSAVTGQSVVVTATAANGGNPVSQSITLGVVKDGGSGTTPNYVVLSNSGQVFSRSSVSAPFAPASLTLTATPYGSTPSGYQWQYWSGSSWTDIAGATGSSYTAASGDFTDSRTYRVEATFNGTVYTDQETLVQVTGGTNAITGFLTNESVTFASDSSGNVSDFSPATGVFHVYDGIVDKTGSGSVAYSVPSQSGCVVHIDVAGTVTVQSMSTDTASATLQAVYGTVTLTKVLSLSKSRAGAAGGATFVVVSNTGQVFSRANAASAFSPTTLTLTATPYGGSATYQWQYLNAGAWTNVASGGTASTYTVNSGDFTGSQTYRVQATINGAAYFDQVTLVQVSGGSNAISGFLTNETAALTATSTGVVSDFSPASGTFKVYDGTTDKTGASVTYSVASQTNCTVAITTAGAVSVSAMTADTATATLQAVYGGVTIQKILSLAKAKAGTNGTNGTNGYNGSDGTRGTVNIAAGGYSGWSDTSATSAISSAGYGSPINRDIVTLYGTSFSQTKYYNNGSWLALTAYINGNMLVSGTVAAAAISTSSLSAISSNLGTVTAGSLNGGTINIGGNFVVPSSGLASLYTALLSRCTASNGDAPGFAAFASTSASVSGAGPAFQANGGSYGYAMSIVGGSNGIVQTAGGSSFLNTICPYVGNGADLGAPGYLWRNLYVASGVINTSDSRVKTDVTGTDLGLAFINALRPVKYKMIVARNDVSITYPEPTDENPDPLPVQNITPVAGVRYHYGLIAQEVKTALDSAGVSDAALWILADPADPESRQALRYEELISPLIKAVQELSARLAILESK